MMKINKILAVLKELVKKASLSNDVELSNLPNTTNKSYVVEIKEIEETKSDLFFVAGNISKNIEIGQEKDSDFTLAGKSADIKGKKYINSICLSRKVSFKNNTQATSLIAGVNFSAMIEVELAEEDKPIKEVDINTEEKISNK